MHRVHAPRPARGTTGPPLVRGKSCLHFAVIRTWLRRYVPGRGSRITSADSLRLTASRDLVAAYDAYGPRRPATELTVVAMITVPKTYESSAWCSAARRTRLAVMSVSETWNVIPIVSAR